MIYDIILRLYSLSISEMSTKCAWRNLWLCQSIFLFIYINTLGEAFMIQDDIHTQTHPPRVHISAVILARFSTVWFEYVAPPSSLFLFSSLSYFGKKTNNNLLLLSLDNGRLCISCICIHKIKMKAEIFPV